MNLSVKTIVRLVFGLFLYALGIVVFAQSNIGMAPWDVLSDGIAKALGISLGTAVIGISIVLLVANLFLGQRIGLGNIINIFLIGPFVDGIQALGVIPLAQTLPVELLMVVCGLMILNFATFFYVGAGLGAGPREGLMIGIVQKTGKSVRLVKSALELAAIGLGVLLGGRFGIATVIVAVVTGPLMNLTFDLIHFDIKSIRHVYIKDQMEYLRTRRQSKL